MERPRVCVVGAGVIGLSSALSVLERHPGVELTIIAEKFTPETTSDGSGGFWMPYLSGATSPELINRWGGLTYDHLNSIIMSEEAREAGVEPCVGYWFYPSYKPDPVWKDIPLTFRHATRRELDLYAPDAKHGWFGSSMVCGCTRYLPWLEKKIRKRGGMVVKQRVENLGELAGQYDVIINCTGLGSFDLVDDTAVAPIQGQVMRVGNVTSKLFFLKFSNEDPTHPVAHIFPWRDTVILGGTAVKESWEQVPSVETRNKIFRKCCKLMPSLKDATILKDWTGLRPWRSKGIRLERERMKFGANIVHVIHNYGHSGSGVTLHWGCAQDAATLVSQCLEELNKLPQSKL